MKKYSNDLEELIMKLRKVIRNSREEKGFLCENLTVPTDNAGEKTQEIIEFPVNNLLFDYMDGKINDLTKTLRTEIEIVKKFGLYIDSGSLQEYDKVKSNMVIRLHNIARDSKLLENAIYNIRGDIALTVYWRADSGNTRFFMRMPKRVIGLWHLSQEKMIQDALNNTMLISPPKKYDVLNWLTGQEYIRDIDSASGWDNGPLGSCISTEEITFGAVAIFLPGIAEKIADIYNGDFYFAFPSQHAVMVHNIETTDPEMIKNSISHLTSDRGEDFLSYHVFRFFRRTGEVEMIS